MGYNFRETMNKPERFAPGHRMCAGCGATICAIIVKLSVAKDGSS